MSWGVRKENRITCSLRVRRVAVPDMLRTPVDQASIHVLHRVFLECTFARGRAEVIVSPHVRRYILCIFLVDFHPADWILSQINHPFELHRNRQHQHPPSSSWTGVTRRLFSISLTYLFACSSEQKCFPKRTKS